MHPTGAFHVAFAIAALAAGAFIVFRPKGTRTHRWVGWAYALSMLGLNATALVIYRLLGYFGPFHIAAVLSFATLLCGMTPILIRRPAKRWLDLHARLMSWSYVGLLAAAAAETTSRLPSSPFWWTVLGATLAVLALGGYVIGTRLPGAIKTVARARRSRLGKTAGASEL